jgi:tetratricopeptide (TPR) repeat protein
VSKDGKQTSLHAAKWSGVGLLIIHFLLVASVAPVQATDDLGEIRELATSGRTYEALAELEPLLVAEPDRVEGLMLKGILLIQLGRVDEAKEIFLGLVKSSPELPEPYINLAAIYAGAGDYDRAVRILKRALATHPSYLTAYENLTKVYAKLASEAYRRALGDEAETDEAAVELVLVEQIHPSLIPGIGAATAVDGQLVETEPPAEPMALALPAAEPDLATGGSEFGAEGSPVVAETDDDPIGTAVETTVETGDEPEAVAESDPEDRATPDIEQVPEMIDEWALAWTEQSVEEYWRGPSRAWRSTWASTRGNSHP